MHWRLEYVADLAHLNQLAAVHDAHAVDKLRHQPHIVAHQKNGRPEALLDVAERLHDLSLDHDVEGAGRLVGDDHLRLHGNRDGNTHTLFHSTAELMRIESQDVRLE